MKKIIALLFAVTFIFTTFSLVSNAQETMKKDEMKKDEMKKDEMKKDEMMSKDSMTKKDEMSDDEKMKMEKAKPLVAVFRADWCPYCKKLEPIMMDLMKTYGEKINFVVFDITDEATTEKSAELAKEKDLEDFFKENKGKSAFVVVFKEGKQVFTAKYKTERDLYVKEFDKVLTK